jgi:hypothetical protein
MSVLTLLTILILLNKVAATHLPNQVTGAVDFLTVTGTGLNARYRTPDSDTYRTADSDYVFWKSDASESTCDGNRLIAWDFPRILVKYLNVAPYTILAIAILKPGVTVTDGMRDVFNLSIWWDGTLSFHGNVKGNKPYAQQYAWTAESIAPAIPTGLTATLISGGVKYDWTAGDAAAQTEVWCRNDSDAYTTVTYTIAAGTVTKSETVNPVDLRYCKIRSLKGGNYSAFTTEVSIAMLGSEVVDQSGWCAVTPTWWNSFFQAGWSGNGSKLTCTSAGYVEKTGLLTTSTHYRLKLTIAANSGGLRNTYIGTLTTSNTYYFYFAATGTFFNFGGNAFNGDITTFSIKQILDP